MNNKFKFLHNMTSRIHMYIYLDVYLYKNICITKIFSKNFKEI